ncbi:ATP-binding protein [Sneathiella glossodoripedis]|uniref:ATP-binding protein n=1 Tax=Sneathiella glossodoripedis TaxID=418853 RepID=UPI000470EA70|nr:ATP-grasp domain-containing protein [Sneathiella glossodoripedis]
MTYLRVKGATALKGPNLVCPYPGVTVRFVLNDSVVADQSLVLDLLRETAHKIYDKPSSIKKLKIPEIKGTFNSQVIDWIGVISILIQRMNGNEASLYRSFERTSHGHCDLFVAHEFESMGRAALSSAVNFVKLITNDENLQDNKASYNEIVEEQLAAITQMYQAWAPRMETRQFLKVATARKIPWRFNDERTKFLEFGYGRKKRVFLENIIDIEGHNTFALTNDKNLTAKILNEVGLPGTVNIRATDLQEAKAAANELGYPVVLKPLMGMQGYGVTPDIKTEHELEIAYEAATKHHSHVIVERHVKGDDHRMLVIGGKYAGCVKRSISKIIGDGKRSITELVAEMNKQDFRNRIPGNPKYQIKKIPVIDEVLKKQGYDWDSIPAKGAIVSMHIVPNASQGGMLEAIDDRDVHPANIEMAERAALQFGLKLGGIDYLTDDISKPYYESGGAICEVNARPAIDVMQLGDPIVQERLCRATFELSFPPEERTELPIIVLVGSDESLGFDLASTLTKKGKLVSHAHSRGVKIGQAPPVHVGQADKAVDAALWDASVEVGIIQETGARIQKYGLCFTLSSLVIFMDVPILGTKRIAKINTLLARTAMHGGYYVQENEALREWIATLDDDLKVKFKPVSLSEIKDRVLSDIETIIGA